MEEVIDILWLDESGDSGFQLERGSSRFLVLAAVDITEESVSEELLGQELRRLRAALGVTEDYEFKFSRCKDGFKRQFFRTIAKLPLQYKAIVVDKKKLSVPAL